MHRICHLLALSLEVNLVQHNHFFVMNISSRLCVSVNITKSLQFSLCTLLLTLLYYYKAMKNQKFRFKIQYKNYLHVQSDQLGRFPRNHNLLFQPLPTLQPSLQTCPHSCDIANNETTQQERKKERKKQKTIWEKDSLNSSPYYVAI